MLWVIQRKMVRVRMSTSTLRMAVSTWTRAMKTKLAKMMQNPASASASAPMRDASEASQPNDRVRGVALDVSIR